MKFPTVLFSALSLAAAHAETFSFYHENVIGTSLELRVSTASAETAKQAEATILAEIDRLSATLSMWSKDSELMRWEASGKPAMLSADLVAVLKTANEWTAKSNGVFNVRVASPFAEMNQPAWKFNDDGTVTYLAKPGAITINALAKGYIIDRAIEKAAKPEIANLTLNIGGDLRVFGNEAEPVAVADPRHDAENAAPVTTVTLRNQSMATSGNYRRGNHIIDPRKGEPVTHVSGASVVAKDSFTANILSTIFNVLKPDESLAMADSLPGVSCLIVSREGEIFRSKNWQAPVNNPLTLTAAAAAAPMELSVDFELDKPEAERYSRPYVAIWLEDKDAFPVRTLSLWILKGEKGLRWLSDLKRWSRSDKTRRLAESNDLVPVISSATRNPGKYSVVWDGLDDNKQPLPAGDYTLYIEAAREHGTYQIIKHPIKVGGEPFKATLDGNVEMKGATLDYHPKAAAN
jgi:thiamine biosynthesis lipoprotein ApbE